MYQTIKLMRRSVSTETMSAYRLIRNIARLLVLLTTLLLLLLLLVLIREGLKLDGFTRAQADVLLRARRVVRDEWPQRTAHAISRALSHQTAEAASGSGSQSVRTYTVNHYI
jgi:Trk-type K+ transport system membrane component